MNLLTAVLFAAAGLGLADVAEPAQGPFAPRPPDNGRPPPFGAPAFLGDRPPPKPDGNAFGRDRTPPPKPRGESAPDAYLLGALGLVCVLGVAVVVLLVREATRGKILKVIIECCLLTDEEKIHMCRIVADCGADFIKTSTGFSKGGATREDVELMRRECPPTVKVKAAGGISSLQDAEDFIDLGADRLGTSRIVKLAMELEKAEGAPNENY